MADRVTIPEISPIVVDRPSFAAAAVPPALLEAIEGTYKSGKAVRVATVDWADNAIRALILRVAGVNRDSGYPFHVYTRRASHENAVYFWADKPVQRKRRKK